MWPHSILSLLLSCVLLSSCTSTGPKAPEPPKNVRVVVTQGTDEQMRQSLMEVVQQCFQPTVRLHIAGETHQANGLIATGIADDEKRLRLVALSPLPAAGGLRRLPIMYELDMNGDGQPDLFLQDTLGDGTCNGFKPYYPQGVPRPAVPQDNQAEGPSCNEEHMPDAKEQT